jgi:hypothetical protein
MQQLQEEDEKKQRKGIVAISIYCLMTYCILPAIAYMCIQFSTNDPINLLDVWMLAGFFWIFVLCISMLAPNCYSCISQNDESLGVYSFGMMIISGSWFVIGNMIVYHHKYAYTAKWVLAMIEIGHSYLFLVFCGCAFIANLEDVRGDKIKYTVIKYDIKRLNDTCAICYEPFKIDQEIAQTNCKHTFCITCLSEWSEEHSNCPNCMQTDA